jgi:hypothetical protein
LLSSVNQSMMRSMSAGSEPRTESERSVPSAISSSTDSSYRHLFYIDSPREAVWSIVFPGLRADRGQLRHKSGAPALSRSA